MFDINKFGRYLSRLRKNADMTQSELADELNLTRQAISKYENGDSFPDITILVQIAKVFNTTVDMLINSGNPTEEEAKLLHDVAVGTENVKAESISSIVGVAPLLKPSLLDKLSSCLAKQDIDISNIVELAEYLSDDGVKNMIENINSNNIELELLSKLVPFLNQSSIMAIFQKILDGEMPIEAITIVYPYVSYSLIEAAVIEGVFPWEVLTTLNPYWMESHIS